MRRVPRVGGMNVSSSIDREPEPLSSKASVRWLRGKGVIPSLTFEVDTRTAFWSRDNATQTSQKRRGNHG
jgi:hypothetical protein